MSHSTSSSTVSSVISSPIKNAVTIKDIKDWKNNFFSGSFPSNGDLTYSVRGDCEFELMTCFAWYEKGLYDTDEIFSHIPLICSFFNIRADAQNYVLTEFKKKQPFMVACASIEPYIRIKTNLDQPIFLRGDGQTLCLTKDFVPTLENLISLEKIVDVFISNEKQNSNCAPSKLDLYQKAQSALKSKITLLTELKGLEEILPKVEPHSSSSFHSLKI